MSNAVSQRANINRTSFEFDVKADSNGGVRTAFNANLRVIDRKLAQFILTGSSATS